MDRWALLTVAPAFGRYWIRCVPHMTSCLASLWQIMSRRRHVGHLWLHSPPDTAWCEASIKHLGPDGVREGLGCVWLIQWKNRHHGDTMSDGSHFNLCFFFVILHRLCCKLYESGCHGQTKSRQPWIWIHIISVATQRAGKNQKCR